MSGGAVDSHLLQALDLGADMLACAEAGEWGKAIALQETCDRQIRLASPAAADRAVLRQLQQMQLAMTEKTAAARAGVVEALAHHRSRHRAVSAYLASSTPR